MRFRFSTDGLSFEDSFAIEFVKLFLAFQFFFALVFVVVVFFVLDAFALTAHFADGIFQKSPVIGVVMTFWAVSWIFCSCSASDVFSVCDGLKMIGIDTESIAARVIKFKSFRNWSINHFPRKTMGWIRSLFFSIPDRTVALKFGTYPLPASIGLSFNLVPKELFDCLVMRLRHCSILAYSEKSGLMRVAGGQYVIEDRGIVN